MTYEQAESPRRRRLAPIEPASHTYFSVETPSVFSEFRLPARDADWSRADWRKFRQLERLAKSYGTYIQCTGYRRG